MSCECRDSSSWLTIHHGPSNSKSTSVNAGMDHYRASGSQRADARDARELHRELDVRRQRDETAKVRESDLRYLHGVWNVKRVTSISQPIGRPPIPVETRLSTNPSD